MSSGKNPTLREILEYLSTSQSFRKLYEKYPKLSKKKVSEALRKVAAKLIPRIKFSCFFDGAAQPNPGPAGAGVVIYKNGEKVKEISRFLGVKTNNQAEYLALNTALDEIEKIAEKNCEISFFSDSQLLVSQIKGLWRTKDRKILRLFALAKKKIAKLSKDKNCRISISHIERIKNKVADSLSVLAIKQNI